MTATASAIGSTLPTRSSVHLLGRLSLMMFLQYFVQGSYFPIASVYVQDALGFTASQVGFFGAALAVGPVLAPFVLGQLVDRLFATERVIAGCHFLAGLLMLWLYFETRMAAVMVLGTLYSVLYVPTMMLTNSLAFHHLRNSELEFPWVRLFGTLGFIVPAYIIELWFLEGLSGEQRDLARGVAFALSGAVGLLMAAYCLTLPRTPPKPAADRSYAPGVALRMLSQRAFLVLVVVSFLIGIVHKFFFVWNSPFLREVLDSGGVEGAYEQTISSVGQIFELVVMLVLGFGLRSLGYKWVLTIGAAAYTLRAILFALLFQIDPFAGKLAVALLGQALHGVCFGCFLAAGYMYVDRVAPRDARGSMQTMYGTCVIAQGFFVGGLFSAWIGDLFTGPEGRQWFAIWFSSAVLAALCTLLIACCFPRHSAADERASAVNDEVAEPA